MTRRNAIILVCVLFAAVMLFLAYGTFINPKIFEGKTKTISAPTYATSDGVMEEAASEFGFSLSGFDYNHYAYYLYPGQMESLTAGNVGVFIKYSTLDFEYEKYEAWGQECYVQSHGYFYLSEDGNFIIPVRTSVSDPSFLSECEKMIAKNIIAYQVVAKQGDGDFIITVKKVSLPFKVEVDQ